MKIRRGDIVLVKFDPTQGTEINKTRPAVVVSNDVANHFSSLATVVPLTSQKVEKVFPYEVLLDNTKALSKLSKAKVNQIRTIDKTRILKKLGELNLSDIRKLNEAIKLHLDIGG